MRGDKKKYPEGYQKGAVKSKKAARELIDKNLPAIKSVNEYLGIESKTYIILKDGKLVESATPGEYAGHKFYKIFGRLDCGTGKKLMAKENRVFFHTLEDAVNQGYRPCKNCRPINEEDFERIKHLVPYRTLEEFYDRDKK